MIKFIFNNLYLLFCCKNNNYYSSIFILLIQKKVEITATISKTKNDKNYFFDLKTKYRIFRTEIEKNLSFTNLTKHFHSDKINYATTSVSLEKK